MKRPLTLRSSLRRIAAAGSLGMIYQACTSSPVTTDYFRNLGATDLQFGLLGGLPMIMLFTQFIGAYIVGRLKRRKVFSMAMSISARILFLLVGILPLVMDLPGRQMVSVLIAIVALSGAFINASVPSFLAWTSDIVPRPILNRFWGMRHAYATLTWTLAYIAVALFVYLAGNLPVDITFLLVVAAGCAAGLAEAMCFADVPEPEHASHAAAWSPAVLLEPFRNPQYRTLLLFWCCFLASAIMAASFMMIYTLKVLQMPVWKANIVWCASGLGAFLVSRTWGELADKHGHRPIIRLCNAFKPFICLVFLLVTPGTAFWGLMITMFFDNMVNAGQNVAVNGYMMKNAPRDMRPVFAAATVAMAGIAGGVGAIIGGIILRHTQDFAPVFLGRQWNNYQLLFLISFCLRLPCRYLAGRIVEPGASPVRAVVRDLRLRLAGPFRLARRAFPDITGGSDENVG